MNNSSRWFATSYLKHSQNMSIICVHFMFFHSTIIGVSIITGKIFFNEIRLNKESTNWTFHFNFENIDLEKCLLF